MPTPGALEMRVQARELVVGAGHDAKTEVGTSAFACWLSRVLSLGADMVVVEGGATYGNVMHRLY